MGRQITSLSHQNSKRPKKQHLFTKSNWVDNSSIYQSIKKIQGGGGTE